MKTWMIDWDEKRGRSIVSYIPKKGGEPIWIAEFRFPWNAEEFVDLKADEADETIISAQV